MKRRGDSIHLCRSPTPTVTGCDSSPLTNTKRSEQECTDLAWGPHNSRDADKRYAPIVCTFYPVSLLVYENDQLSKFFGALPERQTTWNTQVRQRTSGFKASCMSGRVSFQPSVLWRLWRLWLQWWYFLPLVYLVCVSVGVIVDGLNDLLIFLSFCQGCPSYFISE